MDPEFYRLVNQATDIAASGRWATVNARIEGLAANPGENNAWWVQLFGGLCSQNFSEYMSLKRAHENTVAPPVPHSTAVDLMSSCWIDLGAWSRVRQSFPHASMGRCCMNTGCGGCGWSGVGY